ncbi:uncharacterized protein AMSG_10744 [Thecamonas trahens ATCC 50062]|uniref:Uncharacterized protein n=1 Tax=Thecamonas trahens ATCC 50062 TaxID=461836 RepID=A0A0L0DUJ6_THETB|nr:hypothetical protein AMSG_10744 [Thecamonas trahens ATCC 50062]KNC55138.1 hypothetical protein AMSG_10744 [Thecamonas trahens ATCC 50062]|eukprot:XP_013753196.1 hypothetical protein AMSG_10744 [Thecamonas trahens ATCC 50062]
MASVYSSSPLYAAFETLRAKVTGTDLYQPALQVMRHLVSFPRDQEGADKFWRLMDAVMRTVCDQQHVLTGREGLVFVDAAGGSGAEGDGGGRARAVEEEKSNLVAELLRVSNEYEARIEELEASIGGSGGQPVGVSGTGPVTDDSMVPRPQFEAMETRYRTALSKIKDQIAEKEKLIAVLQQRMRRVMGDVGHDETALAEMSARHASRTEAMRSVLFDDGLPLRHMRSVDETRHVSVPVTDDLALLNALIESPAVFATPSAGQTAGGRHESGRDALDVWLDSNMGAAGVLDTVDHSGHELRRSRRSRRSSRHGHGSSRHRSSRHRSSRRKSRSSGGSRTRRRRRSRD